MNELYLSTYDMMRNGAYDNLRNYYCRNADDYSWWDIADQLYASGTKIQIKFSYYEEFDEFIESPPTKTVIKKYIEDCEEKKDDVLVMEAFLFESEKDKLAFLLKWS